MLSPRKLKGVAAFGAAGWAYGSFTTLSLMMGPTAPAIGIVALSLYGATAFNERGAITQIDYLTEGEHAGKIRAKVAKSPFMTYSIIADVKDTRSICAVGHDDLGEDDVEGNILEVSHYIDEATGESHQGELFIMPADANRSKQALEWIFTHKSGDSATDASFSDLIQSNHEAHAATGGLTGLAALNASNSGYADMGGEEAVNAGLVSDPHGTEVALRELTELYGKDKLAEMKPTELYKLYKQHSIVKS